MVTIGTEVVDAAVKTIAGRVAERSRAGPVIVAIDGRSGAGKTSLACRLAGSAALTGTGLGHPPVVSLDSFYPGWSGLTEGVRLLAEWILRPLRTGRPAGYRRYDWKRQQFADWQPVPDAPLVIIEGVGSGVPGMPGTDGLSGADGPDVVVWVEAPTGLRRDRALARDGDAFRPYWDHWAAQEDALFASWPVADRADIVVRVAPDAAVIDRPAPGPAARRP